MTKNAGASQKVRGGEGGGANGWPTVRLGELCRLINGKAFKPSDWSDSGIPIIRIQNLNDATKQFNYWAGPLDRQVLVAQGDVLLGWSGTPGTSFGAHLWSGHRGVLNQHIFRVELDEARILKEWAVPAINHQLGVLIAKAHGGVGLRHVKKAEVEALSIPLPALEEQKRIAHTLKEQLDAVKRVRIAADVQLRAAKALPGAYLREVFHELKGERLSRVTIGDTCTLLPSKSIATAGDVEVRAITTACLTESEFNLHGIKSARMWSADVDACLVGQGEILIARSNTAELVGRVAMVPRGLDRVVASDLTIRVLASERVEPRFLTAYLSFLYLSGFWREKAGGASGSMKKITRRQINALPIPLPTIDKQHAIVERLDGKMQGVRELESSLRSKMAAIEALPASLIRLAFRQ